MNFQTKSEYIYCLLKNQITEGVISQGETINISKIAADNQMSPIPVRESLKRLETEGLVEIIPHKGATVTIYDEMKIIEVMRVRALLEGYAAKTALIQISQDVIEELKYMNKKMRAAALTNDDEKFVELNRLFHKKIYSFCQNKLLNEMIYNLWDGGNWSKALFAYFPELMIISVNEHEEIIEAMEKKDSEKVGSLVRLHKSNSIDKYREIARMAKQKGE